MKRCKHGRTTGHIWRESIGGAMGYHATCDSCGHWLPLGPSNDADEWVRVEIESARIIADVMANVEHVTDWQIAIGMAAHDADNDPPTGGLAWMWHAGWLARHTWKDLNNG